MAYKRKIYHRDEKCLNCDYPIIGNYCGECGQKAHLHKDSFWHMFMHFVGDYFHYDNKFWLTVKTMATQPGLLTKDFISGKRARYLNPVQQYIFISTIFFILFFSLNQGDYSIEHQKRKKEKMEQKKRIEDSLIKISQKQNETDIVTVNNTVRTDDEDTVDFSFSSPSRSRSKRILPFDTYEQYKHYQDSVPKHLKDGKISYYIHKKFYINKELSHEDEFYSDRLVEKIVHNTPKVFFILLPFFALLLLIVYARHKFYYIDHIIFSLHFHSFTFLYFIIVMLLYKIFHYKMIVNITTLIFLIGIGPYLFMSLKKVYGSSSLKTFIKQVLIFIGYALGFFTAISLISFITFLSV